MHQLLPATFKLESNRAPGPVCMMRAAAQAVELAEKFGVATGLVSNPTHVARSAATRSGSPNAATPPSSSSPASR